MLCHGMTMCWSCVALRTFAKMNVANAAMWQRFGFFQLISIARLKVEDKHDSKGASELLSEKYKEGMYIPYVPFWASWHSLRKSHNYACIPTLLVFAGKPVNIQESHPRQNKSRTSVSSITWNLQATSSIQYEVLPLHILKIFTETHRKRSYSVYVWFILLSSSVGKNPHIRLLGSTAKQHNKKVTAVSAVATFSWQGRFRCHQKDQRPVLHPLIDAICPRTKSHNLCNF